MKKLVAINTAVLFSASLMLFSSSAFACLGPIFCDGNGCYCQISYGHEEGTGDRVGSSEEDESYIAKFIRLITESVSKR